MPAEERDRESGQPGDASWYSYAIIRVVPRVERGEYVNVGVILFARTRSFLQARLVLDDARLRALAPGLNLNLLKRHLEAIAWICAGSSEAGPLAAQPLSERFHWLTAPRSTIIQTSPVHVGHTTDPWSTMEELLDAF